MPADSPILLGTHSELLLGVVDDHRARPVHLRLPSRQLAHHRPHLRVPAQPLEGPVECNRVLQVAAAGAFPFEAWRQLSAGKCPLRVGVGSAASIFQLHRRQRTLDDQEPLQVQQVALLGVHHGALRCGAQQPCLRAASY